MLGQPSWLMCSVVGAALLLCAQVALATPHCGQGPWTVTCGNDGCNDGLWLTPSGGSPTQNLNLVFSDGGSGCSYTFHINTGGAQFAIGDINRNPTASGSNGFVVASGSNPASTGTTLTVYFTGKGSFIYFDVQNNEPRGFITVVQDGVLSQWNTCQCTTNCGGEETRYCSGASGQESMDGADYYDGDDCTGADGGPLTAPCPSPCSPSGAWSAWSTSCQGLTTGQDYQGNNYICGQGTQYRTCLSCNPAQDCPESNQRTCYAVDFGGTNACNGGFCEYCDHNCGSGLTQYYCGCPTPAYGGSNCGTAPTSSACNTQACPGAFSNWACAYPCNCGSPSACTRTCGYDGNPSDQAPDGQYQCSGATQQNNPACGPGVANGGWSAWFGCPDCQLYGFNVSCVLSRACRNVNPTQCSNTTFCPGPETKVVWPRPCNNDTWSNWGACTVAWDNSRNCPAVPGGGHQKRTCQHNEAVPPYGYGCDNGNASAKVEWQECNDQPCNGLWSQWSGCSKSCGGGTRNRQCLAGAFNGGMNCTDLDYPDNQDSDVCNTHDCGCRLDLCFALDGSFSIIPQSWNYLKNFTVTLLQLVNAGNGTNAGAVQFADARLTYYVQMMTPYLTTIVTSIQAMAQIRGQTAIGTGLYDCWKMLLNNTRAGIPNVILLITDGTNNDGLDPNIVSNEIKNNGTEIFVIGVGGQINYTDLYDIASYPKEGVHLFNISSYAALQSIADEVTQGLCFGRDSAAAANFYPFFALLALLPLGFGVFVIRRRKPVKKVPPPPPPKPVEPPPPPPVKAATPKPITDKPKDWTVPGTRYIGFGQANIKVKWGTEAPPSAPRGHDKYDRWSMMAHPEGMKPAGPASPKSMEMAEGAGIGGATAGRAPLSPVGGSKGCCERFFPCCCAPKALNKTKAKVVNDDDEDANWQTNPAAI